MKTILFIPTPGPYALQAVGGVAGAILGTLSKLILPQLKRKLRPEQCGSLVFGTGALPFIFGASICFAGGMMAYYRSCLAQAFLALEKHPRLLLLHLDLNYPVYRWNQKRIGTILEGRERGWVEDGMLISSWQTAGAALDVSVLLTRQ